MDNHSNEQIQKHLELVIEANKTTNLTRIDSVEDGQVLHIEDSLSALPEIDEAPKGNYADIGTGGGYPGIPVALATKRNTLLVDSVKKKMAILDNIIKELQIDSHVSTYAGRIEELAVERPKDFSLITARALSSLPSLMELASPLLVKGGRLVCYKVRFDKEDQQLVKRIQSKLGLRLVSHRDLVLSDGESPRCIIVFEKVAEPSIKLPRHVGFAQKKPLN